MNPYQDIIDWLESDEGMIWTRSHMYRIRDWDQWAKFKRIIIPEPYVWETVEGMFWWDVKGSNALEGQRVASVRFGVHDIGSDDWRAHP